MGVEIRDMPAPLPQELREALQGVSFPTIGHFLEEGFVDPAIRALVTPARVVGRAITVRITPPDSTLVHQVTALIEPGDVVVIDTGGNTRHAPVGEMVALAAKSAGGVAIVIDGMCTDIVEIRALPLPLFARGTSLLTTKLHGTGSGGINVPVTCGGVGVNPGDIVMADDNGVLVLTRDVARRVVGRAKASDESEPATRDYLLRGGKLPERSRAGELIRQLTAS